MLMVLAAGLAQPRRRRHSARRRQQTLLIGSILQDLRDCSGFTCKSVVHQFEITPKAFANFSPGFERSREPWGNNLKLHQTLKGLDSCRTLAGFVDYFCDLIPGLSLRLQPWAEISERLRRNFKLMHYLCVRGFCLEEAEKLATRHSSILFNSRCLEVV